jgi:hypothetical protein
MARSKNGNRETPWPPGSVCRCRVRAYLTSVIFRIDVPWCSPDRRTR